MFHFRLGTLIAIPLVLASIHAAIVYPMASAFLFLIPSAGLLLYAITAKQAGTSLDVKSRPGFLFMAGYMFTCMLTLVAVQAIDALSPAFQSWQKEYQMTQLGYKKVWEQPTLGRTGQVLSRGYRWER